MKNGPKREHQKNVFELGCSGKFTMLGCSSNLPCSQLFPKYISGHSHVQSSPSVIHLPPFWHGLFEQAVETVNINWIVCHMIWSHDKSCGLRSSQTTWIANTPPFFVPPPICSPKIFIYPNIYRQYDFLKSINFFEKKIKKKIRSKNLILNINRKYRIFSDGFQGSDFLESVARRIELILGSYIFQEIFNFNENSFENSEQQKLVKLEERGCSVGLTSFHCILDQPKSLEFNRLCNQKF